VEVVSQEISASSSTVPVVDPKERTFGPLFIYPLWWFDDVQDNRHPVLVVVPDDALVRVR
jgi:hypothetical protein